MMQPLKEVAHIPNMWMNRLLSRKQLSLACTCSGSVISCQDKHMNRYNSTRLWDKASSSFFLHRKYFDQYRNVNFTSHPQHFHHSSTVSMSQRNNSIDIRPTELSESEYETKADETLESLSDFFEELQEVAPCCDDYDSGLGNGVLTVHFSGSDGTYVINKQTPNKQIWLSSPITGPKRFDYCDGKWIYVRDGTGLHASLEEEVSEILGVKVSLKHCKYYS